MNETTPKISVIVPVYKAEAYLHRCVDSILAQTFQDFEVLLIDDGSPDRSGEICDVYAQKDRRVRVFHKENGGVSSARNCGLDNAKGEWICFVDSDDFLDTTYLDDFNLNDSRVEFYLQGYRVVDAKNILSVHRFGQKYTNVKILNFLIEAERNCILNSPVCKLFSRDLLDSHRLYFDLNTSYGEDHLFVLNYLLFIRDASVNNKCSYNYVYHESQSLTRRIVPISELLYYTVQCYKLQVEIIENIGVSDREEYRSIVNIRLYSNMMRTIHDCLNSKVNVKKDFYIVRRIFSNLFSSFVGLSLYQSGLVLMLKGCSSNFSLCLFRIVMFIRRWK